MTLKEAIEHAESGGRATCDRLQADCVLKVVDGFLKIVFERTGTCFNFQYNKEFEAQEWRKVEGWASYG